VATTDASVTDAAMTAPIHRQLARRLLLPDKHYLDSGYPSADLLVSSKAEFASPWPPRCLPTPRPRPRAAFTVDWDARGVSSRPKRSPISATS
jgi:hypothetical protein